MIPPRRPIPRAPFEEIIRNGPVGDLQKKQLQGHQKRRKSFLAQAAPGVRAERVEACLQDAMKAEGLDEWPLENPGESPCSRAIHPAEKAARASPFAAQSFGDAGARRQSTEKAAAKAQAGAWASGVKAIRS